MVAGLVLNAICPLVCFSNIVMMTEIASQRVEELAVQQTTRSGRKTGNWSRLVSSMHFNNYFVEHVRGDMNWGGGGEGSSRIKKEFTCYFHGLQGGGGLTEIFIFPTYFSLPPPPSI